MLLTVGAEGQLNRRCIGGNSKEGCGCPSYLLGYKYLSNSNSNFMALSGSSIRGCSKSTISVLKRGAQSAN
jgi:hypothetical protein